MRRVVRRSRPPRAALVAAMVPTWSSPRGIAGDADALTFLVAPGHLPPGQRIYAIGDVHGALTALASLHAAISADLAGRPVASATVVHLGDLIDHGEASAAVVARLAAGPPGPGLRSVTLRGDHEQMLLDALDGDRAAGTDWLHAGGPASLRSWGIPADAPREAWPGLLPPAHVAFLRRLPLVFRAGSYLFVHAGIRPGVPLARQTRDDLLTIRHPFLTAERPGAVVVHGHTVTAAPEVTAARIGIDTGAGLGGRLTCAVLEGDRVAFLSPPASADA